MRFISMSFSKKKRDALTSALMVESGEIMLLTTSIGAVALPLNSMVFSQLTAARVIVRMYNTFFIILCVVLALNSQKEFFFGGQRGR